MNTENIQHLLAMALYMAAVVVIGVIFARRANKDAESYFLGGRSLGPWVTAFSAEASDMSGYLLMGLPGLAYWTGLADAGWTCIGLALGTYLNFLIVSKRLRRYSVAVNAFTVPDFFSHRFHEKEEGADDGLLTDDHRILLRLRRTVPEHLRQAVRQFVRTVL